MSDEELIVMLSKIEANKIVLFVVPDELYRSTKFMVDALTVANGPVFKAAMNGDNSISIRLLREVSA